MSLLNDKLLELQEEWIDTIAESFVEKYGNEDDFSRPFHFGVSDLLNTNNKFIMVIGQEADGFWTYDNKEMTPQKVQNWCIKYFEKQVYGIEFPEYDYYNSSPFWNFFRGLQEKGYSTCWNNLDKIHRYGYNGDDKFTLGLTEEQEAYLVQKYGSDSKSLLQKEIELVKPDALVFITGPAYSYSMKTAFGMSDVELNDIPTKNNFCIDISGTFGFGIPVLWTYHPGFLSRNKGYLSGAVDYIDKVIQASDTDSSH